jgi:hypothetical protein
MPSILRRGKIVQAHCNSWSNRCFILPSGSLNGSRENPDSLRSTGSIRKRYRSLRTCWFKCAISDSRIATELSEDLSPETGYRGLRFQSVKGRAWDSDPTIVWIIS